jgi:SAM-dependent methyltransferase
MNVYRKNLYELVRPLLAGFSIGRALDFGSGDGWFAWAMRSDGLVSDVVAVDVHRRRNSIVEPVIYDGHRLPFDDRSFELAYAFDVLHHCPDPASNLRDLSRCAARYVLLKDHTYHTGVDWACLSVLDEVGNRRFGVRSVYRYQRDWEWFPILEQAGFALKSVVHPAVCETRLPLRWFVNRLHFIALWERV